MILNTYDVIQKISSEMSTFNFYKRDFDRMIQSKTDTIDGAIIERKNNVNSVIKGMKIYQIAVDIFICYNEEFKTLYYLNKSHTKIWA